MSINPKFVLRNPNGENPTSIKFYFYLDKNRFTYSLGPDKKVLPALWDNQTMRPISKKGPYTTAERKANKALINYWTKEYPQVEQDLINLTTRIENVITETNRFQSSKEVQNDKFDFNELKIHLNKAFNVHIDESEGIKNPSINAYVDKFIKDVNSGKRTYTSANGELKKYTQGTINEYKRWLNQWNKYQLVKRKKFQFDQITMEFYTDYVRYFTDKGYTTNSIGKQVKILKALMRSAHEDGQHSNMQFTYRKFKTLSTRIEAVYLKDNELKKLYDLDLSAKPNYEVARDVFLCGCYTALRYSDYSRIQPKHISENMLQIITKKTGAKVIIPIRPELNQILKKYDYRLPRTHEQKINKYIKEVAKLASIDELISIKKIVGGLTKIFDTPKYNLIKTHTARRTGATLMYKANISTIDIMAITGHKKESSLLNYIRVTKEETAQRLASNPFFKGRLLKKVN